MWVGNQTRLTESEDEITRSLPVLGQNQNRQKGGHRWADPEQRHMGQNNGKKHLIPTHRADWPPSIDRQMVKSHPKSIPKWREEPPRKRNETRSLTAAGSQGGFVFRRTMIHGRRNANRRLGRDRRSVGRASVTSAVVGGGGVCVLLFLV